MKAKTITPMGALHPALFLSVYISLPFYSQFLFVQQFFTAATAHPSTLQKRNKRGISLRPAPAPLLLSINYQVFWSVNCIKKFDFTGCE